MPDPHTALRWLFGFIFVVGAGISLGLFARRKCLRAQPLILMAWALAPPIAFWLEYFYFAPLPVDDATKAQLASLNDFRTVSQAIWAGVGAALGALYLHK